MYSLVNIATLVRDLARLPRGDAVAADLLHTFALDRASLVALDGIDVDANAAAARAELVAAHRARPRALAVLAAASDVADDLGIDAYAAASDALEQSTMFGVDEVLRFVRHDVLTAAWDGTDELGVARFPRALDVIGDGILAAWTGDERVGGVWREWVRATAAPPADVPAPEVVDAVASLAPASAYAPVPAEWSLHMHEACWALHLTGRLRDAAVTQLHALRALLAVHAPQQPPLRAVSAVTAAVHASLVADLLDDDTHRAMTQPVFRLVP